MMDIYVCINGTFTAEQKQKIAYLPKKNGEYTLDRIVQTAHPNKPEGFIMLELPNANLADGTQVSFRPERFVPKHVISVTELLKEKELTI